MRWLYRGLALVGVVAAVGVVALLVGLGEMAADLDAWAADG